MYVFDLWERDREREKKICLFRGDENRGEEKEKERKEKEEGELHDSFLIRARFWLSVSQSCERCFESRIGHHSRISLFIPSMNDPSIASTPADG